MKTKLIASILMLSSMTAFGEAALASDQAAGAIIGAGTGALIGHSIDRGDGAVVGGIIGAILGAAIADDDDDYNRHRVVVRQPPRYYGPPPVIVYEAPRVRYMPQPVFVESRPVPYVWRYERHDWRDGRWDRDHDRGYDGYRGHRGW